MSERHIRSHQMSWMRSGTKLSQFLRVVLPTLVPLGSEDDGKPTHSEVTKQSKLGFQVIKDCHTTNCDRTNDFILSQDFFLLLLFHSLSKSPPFMTAINNNLKCHNTGKLDLSHTLLFILSSKSVQGFFV